MEELRKYLTPLFGVNSHKFPTHELSENSVLNTAKLFFGASMALHSDGKVGARDYVDIRSLAFDMLEALDNDGIVDLRHKSHDNLTGVIALYKYLGVKIKKVNTDPNRRYHPRSVIYWTWAGSKNFINVGLCFLLAANLYTCLRPHKIRNGEKIVKSDNELLMILMYQSGLNKIWYCQWVGYLCHKLLVRRFGENIYSGMIDLWYKHDPDHPVKQVWRKIDKEYKWWKA